MRPWIHAAGLLSLLCAAGAAAAFDAGQTCHLPGQRDALRCLRIDVPRDAGRGGTVSLHVAVAPAVRTQAEPDPLFVLAGGPGQAGSDVVFLLDTAFAKVRATRDVVFIDQRGTGRSGRLDCADDPDALARSDDELQAAALACLQGLGNGLLPYTTAAAAEDLDRVRSALGYARINLWGGSYGTRLAQVYAQAHPDRVRSLILDGVVDADLVLGANGPEFQAALDALFDRCTNDAECRRAFPALREQLNALLQRLDATNLTVALPHPRSGQPLTAPLSRQRLLQTLRQLLYSTDSAARLPYLIARADAGDWRPLLALQASSIDLSAAPAASALLLAMTCREDWPRLTAALRAGEAGTDVFGDTALRALDALCGAIALPPAPLPPAQTLDMPALLLSGALDPVTPPARAERARAALPQAQHVIAAHSGHIVSGRGCSPALLRRFLDAPVQPIDAACLAEIALPAFQTSAAGAAP